MPPLGARRPSRPLVPRVGPPSAPRAPRAPKAPTAPKPPAEGGEFDALHPRGTGGRWVKKGDGLGASGPDPRVARLQNRLNHLGYTVSSDGQFGPQTERAVRAFQRDQGLNSDGMVGDSTTSALRGAQPGTPAKLEAVPGMAAGQRAALAQPTTAEDQLARSQGGGSQAYGAEFRGAAGRAARGAQNKQLTGQRNIGPKGKSSRSSSSRRAAGHSAAGAVYLGAGMDKHRGDAAVRGVQQALDGAGFDLGIGGTDGRFGPDTQRAVKAFQRRYGLRADGVVGPKTQRAMKHMASLIAAREKQKPGSVLEATMDKRKGLEDELVTIGVELAEAEAERDSRSVVRLRARQGVVRRQLEEADSKADKPGGDVKSTVSCPRCGHVQAAGNGTCEKCGAALSGEKRPERDVAEATLTASDRKALPKSAYAIPEKAPGPGSYPVHDEGHARAALTRVAQHGTPDEKRRVRAAVKRKHPTINLEEAVDLGLLELALARTPDYELDEAAGGLDESETALLEAADSLAKASSPEPFSKSKTSNWVARGGGLPAYIQHIAHDLVEKRGKSESNAIQMAIGIVKNWASGKGKVDANTRAAASKAVAEWEALKAKNAAKKAA